MSRAGRGARVLATEGQIRTTLQFRKIKCQPQLVPHVSPNGDLFHPCQPLKKLAGNLLELGSLRAPPSTTATGATGPSPTATTAVTT